MCQDEDENEDEHQSFGSFWNLCMTNEPILQCIIVLRAWFVRHSLYPERTKKFVFGFVFVFVLVNEQPIRKSSLVTKKPSYKTLFFVKRKNKKLIKIPKTQGKPSIPVQFWSLSHSSPLSDLWHYSSQQRPTRNRKYVLLIAAEQSFHLGKLELQQKNPLLKHRSFKSKTKKSRENIKRKSEKK